MKIVLSHPTGNQNVRHALTALYKADALARFYTTIGWSCDNFFNRMSPPTVRNKLSRRSYAIPAKFIRNSPAREFLRLVRPLGKSMPTTIDDVLIDLDRRVASKLAQLKARQKITGVFAYEDGALDTLKTAQQLGLHRIYELPIGYWKAGHEIFRQEKKLKPEWASTLTGLKDSPEKLARKDEELAHAGTVLCASSFTKSTLELYTGAIPEIEVIPYGAPPPIDFSELPASPGKRLRLLFVGGLSQRKGLSYLFDSVAALGDDVELTVIGRHVSDPLPILEKHLRACRYIPSLSHGDILREMRAHDLFIFPSLFEGFGLVLLEAMSQGLPCITTANTAGPDIIDHGKDGFIVPIRSTAEIVACLQKVLSTPGMLAGMKRAALAKAAEFNWERYETRLTAVLKRADARGV
jgi:starch synthase